MIDNLSVAKDNWVNIFNKDGNDRNCGILNLAIVSLFSADKLYTLEECIDSIDKLNVMREAVKEASLSEEMKKHWDDTIRFGIIVCERDRDLFKKEEENC